MSPRTGLLVLLFVAGLVIGILPPAAAHGETHRPGLPHVNPLALELEPGKHRLVPLSFEEGEFQEGWVFLLNIQVTNGTGPVRVQLVDDADLPVLSWDLPIDGSFHTLSGRLPETTLYALTLLNTGANLTEVLFYYDQSCNCAQKPIPIETPTGVVVFQIDPYKGDTYTATILEPPAYDIKVHMAVREDDASVWPQDFRIQETSDTTTSDPSGRDAHVFELKADSRERIYFFAEVTAFHPEKVDETSQGAFVASIMIVPIFEKTGSAEKTAPGIAPLLTILAALGAVAWSRRR